MTERTARIAAIAIGLSLMVALEASLRLLPALRPLTLTQELAHDSGRTLRTVRPEFPRRFFGANMPAARGIRMAPVPYLTPPDAENIRVVIAGGSTIQGFPHPRRLAAGAYLQTMLQDAWPERHVEVFNLGITAVASFAVARTVQAALDELAPDIVVVYTGHNEIYGVYGAASVHTGGNGMTMKHLRYGLTSFAATTAMQRLFASLGQQESGNRASLLARMAQAGTVGTADPRRQSAAENLASSLLDIIRSTRQAGAIPVLCTVAANETGFAPANADGGVARRQFNAATALVASGRAAEAAVAFRRALDEDPYPWRATSTLNDTIRTTAVSAGVILADVEAAFRANSPPQGIGWQLMADHLHPTAAGQLLLARTVARALARQSGSTMPRIDLSRLNDNRVYRQRQGDVAVEQFAVTTAMAELFVEPPLADGNQHVAAQLTTAADSMWLALSEAERRGVQHWRQGAPGPLVRAVADQLFSVGDYAGAARHYEAAQLEEPYTIWGDLWATMRWGRCREILQGGLTQQDAQTIQQTLVRTAFLEQAVGFDAALGAFFRGYGLHLLGDGPKALAQLRLAAADEGIQRHFTFDLLVLLAEELVASDRQKEALRYIHNISTLVGKQALGQRLVAQIKTRARVRAMAAPR